MQTYSDAYQQVKNGPWKDFFATQNQLESVTELLDTLSSLNSSGSTDSVTIYPKPEQIFRVFDTKSEDIRVVILGQDPYMQALQLAQNSYLFSSYNVVNWLSRHNALTDRKIH